MLSAADPLPLRPTRITVAGVSGVGKTTYAAEIAARVGVAHTEIDGLAHGPGWTRRPRFEQDVEAVVAGDAWVIEWQYAAVRSLIAERAQMLVWLDLPFRVALVRVVRRTLRRRWTREPMWAAGNLEPPLQTFFTDPENIVRWSISSRNTNRDRVPALEAAHPHLIVVRLRTRREAADWLQRLSAVAE